MHIFKSFKVNQLTVKKIKSFFPSSNLCREFTFVNIIIFFNLLQSMYYNNTLNYKPNTFNPYTPHACSLNDLQVMFNHFPHPSFKTPIKYQSIVIDAEGKGKWTVSQQKCYIKFIQQNLEEMRCRIKRKSQKVFLQMSKLVKTRSADQCRSHHQKILKYHQNLEQIIRYYTQEMFGQSGKTELKQDKLGSMATNYEIKEDFYTILRKGNSFRLQIKCDRIDQY